MESRYPGEACIHCHLCQKNCMFLSKYKIDIGDTEKLKKLSMHCFLCGKCTRVCPKGIDGRKIILEMRRQAATENGEKPAEKGYGMLLWEKRNYRFRNYKNAGGKSVLFPGCNFPSFYPETTKYLAELLKKEADIGIVFDCCGKPVSELGLEKEEKRILSDMNKRLDQLGAEEVVMVCPNCYHFLKGRLHARVTDIYSKLLELGLGRKISGEIRIFPPCPDRKGKELLEKMSVFLEGEPCLEEKVQCCGLGGCASVKEPKLAAEITEDLDRRQTVYTYCASCSGAFTRKGYKAEHMLLKILGREETADVKKSLLNRVKSRYWRKKKR